MTPAAEAARLEPARSQEPCAIPIAPAPVGYAISKRALDLVASLLGLAVAAPAMLAIAAAVRIETPGPIFFRQIRLGLGGRPFTLLKFRSMTVDADEQTHRAYVAELLAGGRAQSAADADDQAQAASRIWVPIPADPRRTRVGRFLHRTHLDELPQLVNVLRGEMSLVGPRPPIPYEVDLYQEWQRRRLSVKPGLTGLWQVSGWGKLSFDEGVALDLEYIDRRSFSLDLQIILRTAAKLLSRRLF